MTEQIKQNKSVCIVDFSGYSTKLHDHVEYWCDYYPSEHLTYFGGEWCEIEPMPSEHEPSEDQCYQWVKEHANNEFIGGI